MLGCDRGVENWYDCRNELLHGSVYMEYEVALQFRTYNKPWELNGLCCGHELLNYVDLEDGSWTVCSNDSSLIKGLSPLVREYIRVGPCQQWQHFWVMLAQCSDFNGCVADFPALSFCIRQYCFWECCMVVSVCVLYEVVCNCIMYPLCPHHFYTSPLFLYFTTSLQRTGCCWLSLPPCWLWTLSS